VPESYDVLVSGAGPGGCAFALQAAQYGLRVLLIDKKEFPRDKVCGDALSGKSVTALRRLGLLEKLGEMPNHRAESVLFSAPNGASIDIVFKHSDPQQKSYGFVLPRFDFDHFLLEEVRSAGITVREKFSFQQLLRDADSGQLYGATIATERGSEEIHTNYVIGADGFASKVARQIDSLPGNGKHVLMATRSYYTGVKGMTNAIELHFLNELKYGYFWIFPLPGGLANVGLGVRKDDLKASEKTLIQLQEQVLQSDRFRDRFAGAEPTGKILGWSLPTGSMWRRNYADGVLLVGDAAGLVDPFTGEGIGNAMTSGMLAAELIYKANLAGRSDAAYLSEYNRQLQGKLAAELKTSTLLQILSGRKYLLNLVIGKAAKSAEIRALISGMIADEKTKEELKSPLFYLRLLFR
jgi:geranylgeranyl reductase family protein